MQEYLQQGAEFKLYNFNKYVWAMVADNILNSFKKFYIISTFKVF
jgi:hypothetical protein